MTCYGHYQLVYLLLHWLPAKQKRDSFKISTQGADCGYTSGTTSARQGGFQERSIAEPLDETLLEAGN